jgi:tetratricopeptide (TPR) repeat protein
MQTCWSKRAIPWCAFILTLLLTSADATLLCPASTLTATTVLHGLRGKVIHLDSQPLSHVTLILKDGVGRHIASRALGYDGEFDFGDLASGQYLLTLQREGAATIGRTIEIKTYPAPKMVMLEITVEGESSATIRETVTAYADKGVRTSPHKPSRVSKKALRAFQSAAEESDRGNRLKAIEYLNEAIREQPDYFEAFNNLGVQYQKLRQWPEAIAAFRQAIEIRGDSAKPHQNLGVVYWERGELQSAIESFQAAEKLDERSALVHSALGRLYLQKQNYVQAEHHLELATRLDPKESRSAFLSLIQLRIIHKDPVRAKQYLGVMLHYFPADPAALQLQNTLSANSKP